MVQEEKALQAPVKIYESSSIQAQRVSLRRTSSVQSSVLVRMRRGSYKWLQQPRMVALQSCQSGQGLKVAMSRLLICSTSMAAIRQ